MLTKKPTPHRYLGIDLHKHYLIAIGVDNDLNQIYGPRRVLLTEIEAWIS